ncbi:MAG: DUF2811 domain-containing protein [Leptolyngbyaceae cyanobacterium CSU_1_3]|jgi:Protein of unknown function (DUF2811)|nr:DUF2811 domain-containing protein [Leptolyngbyaceae cyanobacterium CSU_1_3]
MDTNVSILVEIPETLHQSFLNYIESRPDWDQDRVFSAALSLFLLQNRTTNDRQTARVYLDSLFKRPLEQV